MMSSRVPPRVVTEVGSSMRLRDTREEAGNVPLERASFPYDDDDESTYLHSKDCPSTNSGEIR